MKEDFYHPVFIKSFSELIEGFSAVPYHKNVVYIQKSEKENFVVGVGSNVYGLVPNLELFPKIEEELLKKYQFTAIYKHHYYAKYFVDYIIENNDVRLSSEEVLKPAFKIMHSYDGQIKFTLIFGFWHPELNKCFYGFNKQSNLSCKHTKNNNEILIRENIEEIFEFIEEGIDELIEKCENLMTGDIFPFERVEEIIPIFYRFPKSALDLVREQLLKANEERDVTDWDIYKSFISALYNHPNKIYEEEKIKIDKKVYDYLSKTHLG